MQRRFETAQRLVTAGRPGEARAEFAPVVAALPRDAGSRQFMGYVLVAASDFTGAATEFRAAPPPPSPRPERPPPRSAPNSATPL